MVGRKRLCNLAATVIHEAPCCLSSSTPSLPLSSSTLLFSRPLQIPPSWFQSLCCFASDNCPYFSYRENYVTSNPCRVLFPYSAIFGRFSSSVAAPNVVIKCWACGIEAPEGPFLVCPSCHSVQPLDSSLDYFQIFNMKREYDLDAKDLERKYKDWQKKLHPDLFQTKSEQEREYSAQQSAQVIKAYHTLLKPLSRAGYMLKLQGIHVDEETSVTDPELLMEIMEIRESVEDASDVHALKSIQSQVEAKLEHWQMVFAAAYKKRDFTAAVSAVQRMLYYERVNEEIIKKL